MDPDIRGGAGPFEAAAVVAVIAHVLESDRVARSLRPPASNLPPAWMRSVQPRNPEDPLAVVLPDHRGDPI